MEGGSQARVSTRRVGGRPLAAQLQAELFMMATNGETLLLTLGIPVIFLWFFSAVHVLPVGTGRPVDFLVPGILALAVMSTAMTALGIGTGFDRGYGVLKRLGSTPLGRPRLLAAKITTVVAVELVQAVILVAVGFGLGWSPGGSSGGGGTAVYFGAAAAMVLGTVAFSGVGLLSGRHPQAARQPRRPQHPLRGAAAPRGHAHPAVQAAGMAGRHRPGPPGLGAGRRPAPRPRYGLGRLGARLAGARSSGRSPRRSSPAGRSAGSEPAEPVDADRP